MFFFPCSEHLLYPGQFLKSCGRYSHHHQAAWYLIGVNFFREGHINSAAAGLTGIAIVNLQPALTTCTYGLPPDHPHAVRPSAAAPVFPSQLLFYQQQQHLVQVKRNKYIKKRHRRPQDGIRGNEYI